MGWQEEQAAARAREQQRQADQRAASARQAESIRQENQARNKANRERVNADLFAASAQRDSERRARDQAASDKAHAGRMAQIRRDGQNTWATPSPYTLPHTVRTPDIPAPPEQVASRPSVVKEAKTGGAGIFVVIGCIVAAIVAHLNYGIDTVGGYAVVVGMAALAICLIYAVRNVIAFIIKVALGIGAILVLIRIFAHR